MCECFSPSTTRGFSAVLEHNKKLCPTTNTQHRDKEAIVPEGGSLLAKKKKPLFYSLSRSFYFFFVNVLSRMIFPPLRTNPTDILPLSHIPPFVFFLSPSGGGGVVFVSHSTGLPLPVCNMSSCVGPLNSTTGRKIHPESSRKHSWPFFFVHFLFPFFLSFFYVLCALHHHHHHPGLSSCTRFKQLFSDGGG